jgi:hypothetical protein
MHRVGIVWVYFGIASGQDGYRLTAPGRLTIARHTRITPLRFDHKVWAHSYRLGDFKPPTLECILSLFVSTDFLQYFVPLFGLPDIYGRCRRHGILLL